MKLNEMLKELNLSEGRLSKIEDALKREYVSRYEFERVEDNLKAFVGESEKREAFMKQAAEDRLIRVKAETEKRLRDCLVEKTVIEAGAKNKEIVLSLLELDHVVLEGDRLSGLDEQIAELKKRAPFLFEDGIIFLRGYCPEAGSDILPKVNPRELTYSQTVAFLEKADGIGG